MTATADGYTCLAHPSVVRSHEFPNGCFNAASLFLLLRLLVDVGQGRPRGRTRLEVRNLPLGVLALLNIWSVVLKHCAQAVERLLVARVLPLVEILDLKICCVRSLQLVQSVNSPLYLLADATKPCLCSEFCVALPF